MKNLLSEKFWVEFYNRHFELRGKDKPWKEKLCVILKEKYSPYFRDVDTFIADYKRLPFDFETLRREDQAFREKNSFYNIDKTQQRMW